MPNFTKETVHQAFCNLPEEEKMGLAINCARYGVTPEDIENLCTGILKCVEPFINRTVENLKYWSDNNGKRKECDRCGALYKDKSIISSYIMDRRDLINHYYDMCPDCYKSFREWLNKHKQKEDAE